MGGHYASCLEQSAPGRLTSVEWYQDAHGRSDNMLISNMYPFFPRIYSSTVFGETSEFKGTSGSCPAHPAFSPLYLTSHAGELNLSLLGLLSFKRLQDLMVEAMLAQNLDIP